MLCQMQALGQMSLLPARRLEKFCPGMRRKGRVCLGGDADIVVFDAATVRALHVYIYRPCTLGEWYGIHQARYLMDVLYGLQDIANRCRASQLAYAVLFC